MGNDYRFLTVWRVAGTVQEVMAVLGDAESLPRWWPSVYLSVVPVKDAAPDGTGMVVDLHTKGWLPYTLRWALTITEPMTETGFALTAAGDLNGTGRWTFTTDGPEIVISYDWRVSASKPLLRRLSWLLKPVFSANHRWAMARGAEGGHSVKAAAKGRCHRRRHRLSGGCCTNATTHPRRPTPDSGPLVRISRGTNSRILPAGATPAQPMSAERGRPAAIAPPSSARERPAR